MRRLQIVSGRPGTPAAIIAEEQARLAGHNGLQDGSIDNDIVG